MKLNVVPARTGALWVRLGIQAVLRQPFVMVGLFLMDWFMLALLGFVPLIGPLALVLMPAGALGYMAVTKDLARGSLPPPRRLLAGFQQGRERTRALLKLGLMFAALALATLLAALTLFPPSPQAAENPIALALSTGYLVGTALQVPIWLLFFCAAALSHWYGIAAAKALFFSAVALWKNLGAFAVYGLGWVAVTFTVSAVLALARAVVGAGPAALLSVPLMLMLASMMLASTYFTFRDSFSADPPGDPESPPIRGGAP
jgi:hypothetical protein